MTCHKTDLGFPCSSLVRDQTPPHLPSSIQPLDIKPVPFPQHLDIVLSSLVLILSITIIVKFDIGYGELYEAPEEPIDVGEGLEHIGFEIF